MHAIVYLFRTPSSVMSGPWLEINHGGSLFTTENGKYCKSDFLFPDSQLLNIYQHTLDSSSRPQALNSIIFFSTW